MIKEGLLAEVTSGLRPRRSGASCGMQGLPDTWWILHVCDSAPVNACQVSSAEERPTWSWSEGVSVLNAFVLLLAYVLLHLLTGLWNIKPSFLPGNTPSPRAKRVLTAWCESQECFDPCGLRLRSTVERCLSTTPMAGLREWPKSIPWWTPTDVCPKLTGLESRAGSRHGWRRESPRPREHSGSNPPALIPA